MKHVYRLSQAQEVRLCLISMGIVGKNASAFDRPRIRSKAQYSRVKLSILCCATTQCRLLSDKLFPIKSFPLVCAGPLMEQLRAFPVLPTESQGHILLSMVLISNTRVSSLSFCTSSPQCRIPYLICSIFARPLCCSAFSLYIYPCSPSPGATKQLMPTPRGRRPPLLSGEGLVYRTIRLSKGDDRALPGLWG